MARGQKFPISTSLRNFLSCLPLPPRLDALCTFNKFRDSNSQRNGDVWDSVGFLLRRQASASPSLYSPAWNVNTGWVPRILQGNVLKRKNRLLPAGDRFQLEFRNLFSISFSTEGTRFKIRQLANGHTVWVFFFFFCSLLAMTSHESNSKSFTEVFRFRSSVGSWMGSICLWPTSLWTLHRPWYSVPDANGTQHPVMTEIDQAASVPPVDFAQC